MGFAANTRVKIKENSIEQVRDSKRYFTTVTRQELAISRVAVLWSGCTEYTGTHSIYLHSHRTQRLDVKSGKRRTVPSWATEVKLTTVCESGLSSQDKHCKVSRKKKKKKK